MRRVPTGLTALTVLMVLAGCEMLPGQGSPAVQTLAKVDGWSPSLEGEEAFGMLELAYDLPTAEQLWTDNVPDDLSTADGRPLRPGVYGALDEVDFETSVVALWSSGQSGSCPGWVGDVTLTDDAVLVERRQDGDVCTDDFNPYRLVLVLDRDQVPAEDELPVPVHVGENIVVPSQARAYGG